MDDRSRDREPEVGADVEAAFSLLADDTRLDILRELYGADAPRSFSALRERVGVKDSGQFNYHLKKLTDRFVDHSEDGYELNYAGYRILGAVFADAHGEVTIDPIPIEDPCPVCDEALQAVYDRDHFEITCPSCEAHVVGYPAPPGILRGRDREDLPRVFSQYARNVLEQLFDGFCPFCLGQMVPALGAEPPIGVGLTYGCEHCGMEFTVSASMALLDVPEVIVFTREHGIDIDSMPFWTLGPIFDAEERVLDDASDPAAIEFTIELDSDRLVVRFDDSMTVVDTSRN